MPSPHTESERGYSQESKGFHENTPYFANGSCFMIQLDWTIVRSGRYDWFDDHKSMRSRLAIFSQTIVKVCQGPAPASAAPPCGNTVALAFTSGTT